MIRSCAENVNECEFWLGYSMLRGDKAILFYFPCAVVVFMCGSTMVGFIVEFYKTWKPVLCMDKGCLGLLNAITCKDFFYVALRCKQVNNLNPTLLVSSTTIPARWPSG